MDSSQGATKQDLQELEQRMNKAMEGFVQEILGALSPEVHSLKEGVSGLKEDVDELKLTTNRIERKLDATIEQVDDHDTRIEALEAQAA